MNGTVLESSDNGNSWTHLKHGNSPTQLNTLWNAMDLNDDGIILVGENGKVLWYNFNDEKFRKLDIGTDDDLTSVKISYQVVYACTRQGHMIKFNLP